MAHRASIAQAPNQLIAEGRSTPKLILEDCWCMTQANLLRLMGEIKVNQASQEANTPDCDLDKGGRLAKS